LGTSPKFALVYEGREYEKFKSSASDSGEKPLALRWLSILTRVKPAAPSAAIILLKPSPMLEYNLGLA